MATRRPIFADISGANTTALREIPDADFLPVGIIPGGMGRNALINGDFRFWQRATSSAAAAARRYVADRWEVWSIGSTMAVSQQLAAGLPASAAFPPKYCMQVVVASVAGAGNFAFTRQHIEDCRMFAGKKATFWFWIKCTTASQVAASLDQNPGIGGSGQVSLAGQKTSLAANTWTLVPFTFDVPAFAGAQGTSDSLICNIWLDAGANHNARTASLGQRSGTYQIAQAMITEGDQVLPFEYRHDGIEFALCQRYYEKSYDIDVLPGSAVVSGYESCVAAASGYFLTASPSFRTTKRAAAAINIYRYDNGALGSFSEYSTTGSLVSSRVGSVTGIGVAGFEVRGQGDVNPGNICRYHWAADAEF